MYGGSGNTGPNFSLPGCVPYDETVASSVTAAASSSVVASTSAAASSSAVATTSASVSNPTLGTTISSASVSNPTLATTVSSESVSTTISTSNPILTVTGPSYGPGPGPETTYSASNPISTIAPPTYGPGPQPSYLPPGFYNTTVTFSSRSTTLTYAPPIEPTTATLEEDTTVYIPVPVPTTVTFEDTTYTYGPENPVPTTDSPPILTVTEPGTTIVYSNPSITICTRTGDLFGCGGPDAGTTLITATVPGTTIVSQLPLPTTTFVGPSYTAGPTGGGDGGNGGDNGGGDGGNGGGIGDGGSGGGASGNGTYTIPAPSQTGGPYNTPVGPSATNPGIPAYTGAAASNAAGLGLAILGLAAAFAL